MFESKNEIFLQYDSLRKTQAHIDIFKDDIAHFFSNSAFSEVVFIACGSSYWLSLSAHMTFMEKTGMKASAVKAGDIVLNEAYYSKIYQSPLIIIPSRSGTTTEVLEAVRIFKKAYGDQTPVFSIVIYEDSPLEALSDFALLLPWANEISVCQTRSFSTLYLASCLIAAIVGQDTSFFEKVKAYLNQAESLFQSLELQLKPVVDDFTELVVLGSGVQYGVAVEGAYINIEMACLPSSYYGTMELRHGPIVRVHDKTLVICVFNAHTARYCEDILKLVKEKGGRSMIITDDEQFDFADFTFSLKQLYEPEILALYAVSVMQGLAYLKAVQLGINPDKPQGLVPFIEI